ncbi:MAG: AraC family transcriptional regulator [Calditrichaeota bacterium]|nr:MAG: AraC family transcriptional regulator [Calditrichota bacterium]
MPVITVPDDIFPGETACPPVGVLDYKSNGDAVPARVDLKYHLFSFIQEGHKEVWYAGLNVSVPDGAFLWLPARRCVMAEKRSASGNYNSVLFFFNPSLYDMPPALPDDLPVAFYYDDYVRTFVRSLLLTGNDTELLRLKVLELARYLTTDRAKHHPPEPGAPANSPEERIRRLVETNRNHRLGVEEMAFLCHMSVATFRRHFTRMFGMAPREWLFNKRMRLAARYLRREHAAIGDVAQRCGFMNPSAFSRAFKRYHGYAPGVYRRKLSDSAQLLTETE